MKPHAETSTCTMPNNHNRQTSMIPEGFELTIPASEGSQTHAVDRADAWIGLLLIYGITKCEKIVGFQAICTAEYRYQTSSKAFW
jgi:hypothetical protein